MLCFSGNHLPVVPRGHCWHGVNLRLVRAHVIAACKSVENFLCARPPRHLCSPKNPPKMPKRDCRYTRSVVIGDTLSSCLERRNPRTAYSWNSALRTHGPGDIEGRGGADKTSQSPQTFLIGQNILVTRGSKGNFFVIPNQVGITLM